MLLATTKGDPLDAGKDLTIGAALALSGAHASAAPLFGLRLVVGTPGPSGWHLALSALVGAAQQGSGGGPSLATAVGAVEQQWLAAIGHRIGTDQLLPSRRLSAWLDAEVEGGRVTPGATAAGLAPPVFATGLAAGLGAALVVGPVSLPAQAQLTYRLFAGEVGPRTRLAPRGALGVSFAF